MVVGFMTNILKFDNVLDLQRANQEHLLKDISYKFALLDKDEIEKFETLDLLFKFENSYGFVYRNNVVVYEMDKETTAKYKNSTARELFNDYSQDSGNYIVENVTDIINNEYGTLCLTKNNDFGEEIITWRTVNIYDNSYVIGISTPIESVLEGTNYYTFFGIFIITFVINVTLIIALCLTVIKLSKKIAA